jgi:hypothetical protein
MRPYPATLSFGGGVALLLIGVVAVLPARAQGSEWLVSGSLAGTYSNSVTWVNCQEPLATGTARESLTLDVKIRAGAPALYKGTGIILGMRMVSGGNWSVSGSYPPRTELPEDAIGCGTQRSFQCGGKIVSERNGTEPELAFRPLGRRLLGNFLTNDFFKETTTGEACALANTAGGPLLGLAESDIETDAFAENESQHASFIVAPARFAGRKPFTISRTSAPAGGCTAERYSHCEQSGRITLTLHFRRTPRD